jgi:hypothetical protein
MGSVEDQDHLPILRPDFLVHRLGHRGKTTRLLPGL